MTGAPFPRLLGDVGGTNARFAWQSEAGAALTSVVSHRCEDDASLLDSIQRYRHSQGLPVPASAAIGMANPITGDAVQMTNHHWSFSVARLEHDLGVQRLAVINDFTALALSLPTLRPADLHRIGSGEPVPQAAQALLGPGTGLGVSGLLPGPGGHAVPIAGEGGHVTLSPCDAQEAAVVDWLRERYGHPSAERALSGPGLVNLYLAAAGIAGQSPEALDAAAVVQRARDSTQPCQACRAAVELFCSFLGSVAGNLALTLGARGGVYVGGGIAPRLLPELSHSRFRERFESKGRFRGYLAGIPTFVIQANESPALMGASRALDAA